MTTTWKRFVCWLLGHDAEGPDNTVSYEITPGRWHPFYHCRRCHRSLQWDLIDGGWIA